MNEINKNDSPYLIFNSDDEDKRGKVLKSYERAYVLKIYQPVHVPTDNSKSNIKKVENNNDELSLNDNVAVKIEENIDSEQTSEAIAATVAKINRLASNVRKEKSPSVLVTLENVSTVATIDEGTGLNCIDENFCLHLLLLQKQSSLTPVPDQSHLRDNHCTKEFINKCVVAVEEPTRTEEDWRRISDLVTLKDLSLK